MIDSIEGGAGECERRRHDAGVVSAGSSLVASRKRRNGEGRGDHDRRMGDIDDVEQPERDREP